MQYHNWQTKLLLSGNMARGDWIIQISRSDVECCLLVKGLSRESKKRVKRVVEICVADSYPTLPYLHSLASH